MKKIQPLLFGFVAASVSLIIETLVLILLGKNELSPTFFTEVSYLLALFVLIEEILKYIFINRYCHVKNATLGEILFIGAGFSVFEIGLNTYGDFPTDLSSYLMLTGIVLIQLLTSAFMGWRILETKNATPLFFQAKIIFFAFLLHFLYNVVIIQLV